MLAVLQVFRLKEGRGWGMGVGGGGEVAGHPWFSKWLQIKTGNWYESRFGLVYYFSRQQSNFLESRTINAMSLRHLLQGHTNLEPRSVVCTVP